MSMPGGGGGGGSMSPMGGSSARGDSFASTTAAHACSLSCEALHTRQQATLLAEEFAMAQWVGGDTQATTGSASCSPDMSLKSDSFHPTKGGSNEKASPTSPRTGSLDKLLQSATILHATDLTIHPMNREASQSSDAVRASLRIFHPDVILVEQELTDDELSALVRPITFSNGDVLCRVQPTRVLFCGRKIPLLPLFKSIEKAASTAPSAVDDEMDDAKPCVPPSPLSSSVRKLSSHKIRSNSFFLVLEDVSEVTSGDGPCQSTLLLLVEAPHRGVADQCVRAINELIDAQSNAGL